MRDTPNGLTIEEIARAAHLSRTTATKYLNSLFVSGQLNMRKSGPAKIYSLSARLPADQVLSKSSGPVLILDDSYTVREASESFLHTFGIRMEDLAGRDVVGTAISPGFIGRIRDPVKQALAGRESVVDAWIPIGREWRAFCIRVVPLVFGWGAKGVAIRLEDQTGELLAREENSFLADMLNDSPLAITVVDFLGNHFYSNTMNGELHGYSAAEFLKLNLRDIDCPKSAQKIAGHMNSLKEKGRLSFEVEHLHRDGHRIPLEVHAKVVKWGDRDVIVSIATDITERKRAESVIRESEDKFRTIFEHSPYPIAINSAPEQKFLAVNPAFLAVSGYTEEELLGKNPVEAGILSLAETAKLVAHSLLSGRLENVPLSVQSKDGRKIHVIFSSIPVTIAGRSAHLTVTAEVTKLKRIEEELLKKTKDLDAANSELTAIDQELRKNNELLRINEQVLRENGETFRALVEQSGEGIIIVDFSGIVRFANRRAFEIAECPPDLSMMETLNIFDLISRDFQENAARDFQQIWRGIDSYEVYYKIVTLEQNEKWVACIGKKITFRGTPAVLISFRDITGRKLAEEDLRESEQKFSTLFEDNPVPLTLVSAEDGRFADINEAFLNGTGFSRQEVIGRTATELNLFSDPDAYAGMVARLGEQKQIRGLEMQCRKKNGDRAICRFSSRIILMRGQPHIISTIEDITERRAADIAFQTMVSSMLGTSGPKSLDRITENLAAWLRADCVMIGRILPDRKHVEVLSMIRDGKRITGFCYALEGTPCEDAAAKGFCYYTDNAAQAFPQSRDLREFGIRGYAGTPLRNSDGKTVGIISIMTREPLDLPPSARQIIDIIAVKAASEIGSVPARGITGKMQGNRQARQGRTS
ncbi:PAS domain S-box protein [Methanoregula sp.]|uniref:PAS domain S-box protein n=1 Tax=Methanoregula sp. TaxID=2052170 RepID=UPI0026292905|nr:PAS domain S-box protein [Methanoregula sp.]MDD5143315.1 PAS domain S-box protein [Methanoregula sp.]